MGIDLDIVVASGNPGKRQEFQQIIASYGVVGAGMRLRLHTPDGPPLEIDETGGSYLANARLKARRYSSQYNTPALGDDSGLAVDALGGQPGLHTARFGGPGLTPAQRVNLLLERLESVSVERRGAHFECALCLAYPDGRTVTAHGRVFGRIANVPRGAQGFGYDPVFLLPSLGRTMAELAPAEKHRLSHRGHAVANLLRKLATGTE